MSMGFNCHYLLEFFGAVAKAGEVRMEMKDEQSAVQFCPVDQETHAQQRFIVMPLRV